MAIILSFLGAESLQLLLVGHYIFFTNFAGASDKRAAKKRQDAAMKTHSILACSVLVAIFSGIAAIQAENQPAEWVEQAVSVDASVARKAQDHLRQAGPHGLELLEQRFAKEIAAHRGDLRLRFRFERGKGGTAFLSQRQMGLPRVGAG